MSARAPFCWTRCLAQVRLDLRISVDQGGARERTHLKTQVDPGRTPHGSLIWMCAHSSLKLSVYGSRNQTNNHKSEEPMTKLEEKLKGEMSQKKRESDDDEGTCVASLGVATGVLPFHQDPLAILHSYVGIK